ncbi:MAG: YihY/virulence factor BrkB family protein, partial [Sphingomonas sp.]|nr:YihY/virulence factor BrkB family protein [Sphingomonas sp.]
MNSTIVEPAQNSAAEQGRHADSPWQMPFAAWKEVAIRTWRESSKDNIGIVAAGVAFYGFLALVPLLGAMVLTYGMVAEPQSVIDHMQSLTRVMPADVAELIGGQLMNVVQTSGGKKGLGLLLALAIALWGARNAAGSIVTALNIAYEEEEKRGFLKVTLLALAMTVAAVLMALLAVAASSVLGYLHHFLPDTGPVGLAVWKVLTFALLAAAAAGAVAALYRYGPSREKARWTWITPGSAFAALGWLLLTLGFGFYVANFGNYNATYGSLGAAIVLLTWLYLSSYVLLFGAEMNSELEHQTARDTTEGAPAPLGARGAWAADNVAGAEQSAGRDDNRPDAKAESTNGQAVAANRDAKAEPSKR